MIPTRFRNYLLLLLLIVAAGYCLVGLTMGEYNPLLWDKNTRSKAAGGVVCISLILWFNYFD